MSLKEAALLGASLSATVIIRLHLSNKSSSCCNLLKTALWKIPLVSVSPEGKKKQRTKKVFCVFISQLW